MQSLVVFLALAVVAHGSFLAQPAHIVLDPYGRPLDTAEVIGARALHLQAKALESGYLTPIAHSFVAPAVVAAPSAVSHQSRVDLRSSPAIVATETYSAPVLTAAPIWGGHSAYASPLLVRSGLLGHGHLLKKRSLGHWGTVAYTTPLVAPSAVSHQSRVDVVSSPTVISHTVAAPVLRTVAAPVVTHAVAPVVHAIAPSSVSHQSRVDVQSSPAIITENVVAAPLAAAPIISAPIWGSHSAYASPLLVRSGLLGHGHFIKKRSLGHWGAVAYATPLVAPSAVSHQSRVDVVSSPALVSHTVAAPVLTRTVATPVVHAIAPSAVSHQSRVDVRSSPTVITENVVAAPLVHAAPIATSLYGHGLFGW